MVGFCFRRIMVIRIWVFHLEIEVIWLFRRVVAGLIPLVILPVLLRLMGVIPLAGLVVVGIGLVLLLLVFKAPIRAHFPVVGVSLVVLRHFGLGSGLCYGYFLSRYFFLNDSALFMHHLQLR